MRPVRTQSAVIAALLVLLLAATLAAQERPCPASWYPPGTNALEQSLRKLRTTARLMHITAHPDDEDGGMLTLYARGRGASVLLLTLTRGEGGQNEKGAALLDELGVLRTLELLASDKFYGVEQRFTRAADFGYSKSAAETMPKWQQDSAVLRDVVRAIREFRPDVITSRFQGTRRDGHGQHEAAGLLAREAFRAAADPNRFPEQIRGGLQPWQAKKLYADGFGVEDATLQIETTVRDEALGTTYAELALKGLQHQLSQGAGNWNFGGQRRFSRYKILDAAAGVARPASEQDFFEGLAVALGGAESADAAVVSQVRELERLLEQAWDARANREKLAAQLLGARAVALAAAAKVRPDSPAGSDLAADLAYKRCQLDDAIAQALGLQAEARVERADLPDAPLLAPGEQAGVTVLLHSDLPGVTATRSDLILPPSWKEQPGGSSDPTRLHLRIPQEASPTRPYWRRDSGQDAVFQVADPRLSTLPLPPVPIRVQVGFRYGDNSGSVQVPLTMAFRAPEGTRAAPVAIAPSYSLALDEYTRVLRAGAAAPYDLRVKVRYHRSEATRGTLRLELPAGWRSDPQKIDLRTPAGDGESSHVFRITPATRSPGTPLVRAVLQRGDQSSADGYRVVTREDLDTSFYYHPAEQRVSVVEAAIPPGLKVAYVPGSGDDIPAVLKQLGVNVTILDANRLASTDLRPFGTVVLGIRAYDTQPAVRENNPRLLDYVKQGGTLVVQYNTEREVINGGNFGPFPLQITRDRVSQEDAPVRIMKAEDPLFQFPNRIGEADFNGWVQERGLYFATGSDPRYDRLLATSDQGEPALDSGLLRARHGNGTYIYTSYSFFRQLPAGVPGAIRLFLNLLSAGHPNQAQRTAAATE